MIVRFGFNILLQGFECKVLRPYFENPIKDVYIPYIFMEWAGVKQNVDNNCPGDPAIVEQEQEDMRFFNLVFQI